MAFTEFCTRLGGDNLNAGTVDGLTASGIPPTAATVSDAGGTWVNATRTYTMQSLSTTGILVGMWASIYVTSGATVATFIGKITTVTSTTFVISSTLLMGTNPADGTGTLSARIGGAWLGPSGGTTFPFNLIATSAINASGQIPRLNMKNDQTHTLTSSLTTANSGPIKVQGFTTVFDDLGKINFNGVSSGTAIIALNINQNFWRISDLSHTTGATAGNNPGLSLGGNGITLERISISNCRGPGISVGGSGIILSEVELYVNNRANTANSGSITVTGACFIANYCTIHDNSGTNNSGVVINATGGCSFNNCIFDTNQADGVRVITGASSSSFLNCDFYNNTNGISLGVASGNFIAQNCSFVKNSTAGITCSTTSFGDYLNCGFPAAGTTANGTDVSVSNGNVSGYSSLTIPANTTPWIDPDNGDFRVSPTSNVVQAGRGVFTELQAGYAGTIGYPDIGAAQAIASSGGSPLNVGIRSGGRL